MFRSLRSKLVASYALVILLCLLLAGSGFVYFVRDYQRQIKLNQLADLALPLSWQVRLLERAGAPPDQIALFLRDRASELEVRALLVDPTGLVVEDTEGTLRGDRIQIPPAVQVRERSDIYASTLHGYAGNKGFVFIAAATRTLSPSSDRFVTRVPFHSVVLAVPEQSLTANWLELAPSLSIAALVSLIVSIGVAILLSRSISGPVVAMTKASEEMAKGNYDQHIQVRGQDELGRLARAFNHMAQQVSVSNRTLRDFLANVSHELRTPLTSVQGFSQAMVDGTLKSPEDYAGAATIINEEAGRMRRLVENLLLLSKIESGQIPMERAALDLRELLRASVRRVTSRAQELGVDVRLEADRTAPMVGDESQLEQLFRNLLDNALQHTPRGGAVTIKLDVSDGARLDAGGQIHGEARQAEGLIRVSVHNTGSYIPAEDQGRIFERFYQVDKSRARNGEGSGLGLAIAREIAHAHGGTISVESDKARGTSFVVAFGLQRSALSKI